MKFLVDAQLPHRLARQLSQLGHDALHTRDLPDGNYTTDIEILRIAERESRVVVTKDADFVASFTLSRKPQKLLLISTGNISNNQLDALLLPNIWVIVETFKAHDFVEVNHGTLVIHD